MKDTVSRRDAEDAEKNRMNGFNTGIVFSPLCTLRLERSGREKMPLFLIIP
jgi:hypothetical protein